MEVAGTPSAESNFGALDEPCRPPHRRTVPVCFGTVRRRGSNPGPPTLSHLNSLPDYYTKYDTAGATGSRLSRLRFVRPS
jgi:hypothetical protein